MTTVTADRVVTALEKRPELMMEVARLLVNRLHVVLPWEAKAQVEVTMFIRVLRGTLIAVVIITGSADDGGYHWSLAGSHEHGEAGTLTTAKGDADAALQAHYPDWILL